MQRASLLLLLCWAAAQHRVVGAGEAELEQLINKMESDVVELARAVENAYQNRCESALGSCLMNNYDECLSEYPSPICPATDELVVDVCRGGGSCASLIDTSVSAVSLPRKVGNGVDGNPTDPQVSSIIYIICLWMWSVTERLVPADRSLRRCAILVSWTVGFRKSVPGMRPTGGALALSLPKCFLVHRMEECFEFIRRVTLRRVVTLILAPAPGTLRPVRDPKTFFWSWMSRVP